MADPITTADLLEEVRKLNALSAETERQTPEQRQAALLQDSKGLDFYKIAANAGVDRDLSLLSPLEAALHKGDWAWIRSKYGEEGANFLLEQSVAGGRAAVADAEATRSWTEAGTDAAVGSGASIVGTFQGLGAAVALPFSPETAADIVQTDMRLTDDFFNSGLSEGLLARRRAQEARLAASREENLSTTEKAVKEGAPNWWEQTKRFGLEFGQDIADSASDPMLLGQGTVEAGASMLTASAMTAPIKAVGMRVVAGSAEKIAAKVGTEAAEELTKAVSLGLAKKAVEKSVTTKAFMAAAGLQSGSGAAVSAVENVMGRSVEDLMKSSSDFRKKVAELEALDVPRAEALEQAKLWLAQKTGLIAGAASGLAGAAFGYFGAGGATPTKVFRSLPKDILGEGLEEGLDEGIGGVIQAGVEKLYVDENKDLATALGSLGGSTGRAAMLGLTSAGAMKTPGAILSPEGQAEIANAAMAPARLVGKIGDARLEKAIEGTGAATSKAVDESATALGARAQEHLEVFRTAVDGLQDDVEIKAQVSEKLSSLVQVLQVNELPPSHGDLAPEHQQKLAQAPTRIAAILRTADLIRREKNKKKKQNLAIYLEELKEPLKAHQGMPASLDAVLQDAAASKVLKEYHGLLGNLSNVTSNKIATKESKELLKGKQADIPAVAAPQSKPAVRREIAQALLAPGTGNLNNTAQILKHAEGGDLNLTPTEEKALKQSFILLRAEKAMDESRLAQAVVQRQGQDGSAPTLAEAMKDKHIRGDILGEKARVHTEVTVDQTPSEDELSAAQHADRVVQAMHLGDKEAAGKMLADFGMFVQHMQNKVEALNKHLAAGDPKGAEVPYDQLIRLKDGSGAKGFARSDSNPKSKHKGMFVNTTNAGSVGLAQEIGVEAKFVHDVYSGLVEAFPELAGKKIQAQTLNTSLHENAAEVVKKAKETWKAKQSAEAGKSDAQKAEEARKAEEAKKQAEEEAKAKAKADAEQKALKRLEALKPVVEEILNRYDAWRDDQNNDKTAEGLPTPEEYDLIKEFYNVWLGNVVAASDGEVIVVPAKLSKRVSAFLSGFDRDMKATWATGKSTTDSDDAAAKAKAAADAAAAAKKAKVTFTPEKAAQLSHTDLGKLLRELDKRAAERGLNADEEVANQVLRAEQAKRDQAALDATFSPKMSLKKVYRRLIDREGKLANFLVKSFKIQKNGDKPPTRTFLKLNPAALIQKALSHQTEFNKWLGKGEHSKKTFDKEIAKTYAKLLDTENPGKNLGGVLETMNVHLEEFLNKVTDKKGNRTNLQRFRDGDLVHRWLNGKALNILEETEDGKIQWNPELVQLAALAGIQWWITSSDRQNGLYEGDLEALLGGEDPALLTPKELAAIDQGVNDVTAKTSLARLITQFWGVQGKADADIAYTEGIPESMAAEVIRALITRDMMDEVQTDVGPSLYPVEPGKKQRKKLINRYVSKSVEEVLGQPKGMVNAIQGYNSAIEEAVLLEPEQRSFYGDDVIPVAQTQLGNPFVKLKNKIKTALGHMQDQTYQLNMPMVDWLISLGEIGIVEYFGTPITPFLNESHKATLEGQNLTLVGAFKELQKVLEEMRNIAGEDGDVSEVKKRYQFAVTSVNRIMMQGPHNPQASKLMREAILPTWATVDVSTPGTEDYNHYMLSLAQALGIKVHKKNFFKAITDVHHLINGPLLPVIDMLAHWDESAELDENGLPTSKGKLAQLKEAATKAGVPNTFIAMHALMDQARLQSGKSDPTAHRTAMYLEADGMTNGPFNALGLLSLGAFTRQWVESVMKGGLVFSKTGKTADLNKSGDLYETSIDFTQTHVTKLLQALNGQKNRFYVRPHANHFYKAMSLLIPDVQVQEENGQIHSITLRRGVAKNPLTITVYGSGARGIAGKISGELIDAYYEKLSLAAAAVSQGKSPLEVAQAVFPESKNALADWTALNKAMDVITGHEAMGLSKKGMYYLAKEKTGERPPATARLKPMPKYLPEKSFQIFQFDKLEKKALQQNMLTLFVGPMDKGIKETLGEDVFHSGKLMVQATQVQTLIAKKLFEKAIEKKIADRKANDPTFHDGDLLSRADIDGIMEELRDVLPSIEIDEQAWLVSKEEYLETGRDQSGTKLTHEAGRGLDDSMRTPAQIMAPSDPKVAAIPYVVQGLGDGRMIRELYQEPMDRTMEVYDGVHMPIDQIRKQGEKCNKAALHAFQGNPLRGIAESFSRFLDDPRVEELVATDADIRSLIFSLMADETESGIIEAQNEAFGDGSLERLTDAERVEKESKEGTRKALQAKLEEIKEAADSVDDRIEALAQVAVSIDQMAGASAPYVRDGIVIESTDPDEIVRVLEELRKAAKAKRLEKRKAGEASPPVEAAPAEHPIFSVGRLNKATGVRILSKTAIKNLIAKLELTPSEKATVGEILRSGATADYQIVVGTREQIEAYQQKVGHTSLPEQTGEELHGFVSPGEKTIYVMSGQTETVVHELVHAATYAKVLAYYEGQIAGLGPNAPEIQGAIQHLEELLEHFRNTAFEAKEGSPLDLALRGVMAAIQKHELNSTATEAEAKAGALNEFMAWTLANRELASKLAAPVSPGSPESKLLRITKAVWREIKKLVWGRAHPPKEGADLLSQIRFNTGIITRSQTPLGAMMRNSTMAHATGRTETARITAVRDAFVHKIVDRFQDPVFTPELEAKLSETSGPLAIANDLAMEAQLHFNKMTPEETTAFKLIVGALATEAAIAPNALHEAQRMFNHLLQTLTPDDFNTGDPGRANEQYRFLFSKALVGTDSQKRSTMLPVFLAMATVNEEFRAVLAKQEMPKTIKTEVTGVDTFLENLGSKAMDTLSDRLSGVKNPTNMLDAIDQLNSYVTKTVLEEQEEVQKKFWFGRAVDAVEEQLKEWMQKLGAASRAKGSGLRGSKNKVSRAAGAVLNTGALILSEKEGAAVAQEVMGWVNKADWGPAKRELVHAIVGRTDDDSGHMTGNAPIYDMVKQVRSKVQRLRQNFRDTVPEVIRAKFSRKLEQNENTLAHKVMGRFDLATMMDAGMTATQVLDLVTDPQALNQKIADLESQIQKQQPDQWKLLDKKINQYVEFVRSGIAGPNLLTNAWSIAALFNENRPLGKAASESTIAAIDQLLTLRMQAKLPPAEVKAFADLVQNQREGMEYVLSYLKDQRKDELAKLENNPVAKFNHYKGHMPTESHPTARLVVDSDDAETAKRRRALGYRRIGTYTGSSIDVRQGSYAYYWTPEGLRSPFSQGIVQNVQHNAYGVHQETGWTVGPTAGVIRDPDTVEALVKKMKHEHTGTENLRPIHDEHGKVTAFERMLAPDMLKEIAHPQGQDLAKMLGQWRGRQIEEEVALEVNRELIRKQLKMHKEDLAKSPDNAKQYVDVFASSDPVIRDAVSLFTPQMIAELRLQQELDENERPRFFVRKELLNDVIGYRNTSIGDFWTGPSRISKEHRETLAKVAQTFLGEDAYLKLVKLERNWMSVTSTVRTNIVVRSVVVPLFNMLSGVLQLISRGVGFGKAGKGLLEKTAEIEYYAKSFRRKAELEADLRANAGKVIETQRLQAELQSIEDSHRRLSIWPLLEAGEFSSITDVGMTVEDLDLTNGNWMTYLARKVDQLPPALRNPARQGYLARDTALFQGLQKATQYGDFIMKAIYFDHLTKTKPLSREAALAKMTEEQERKLKQGKISEAQVIREVNKAHALGKITEEFNNYDLLPGRTRGYLENIGLAWFLNYKLKAAKIALSIIRNNPLHALLAVSIPHMGIGGPLTDNIFSTIFGGVLGHSLGPGMLVQGVALNPFVNLVDSIRS